MKHTSFFVWSGILLIIIGLAGLYYELVQAPPLLGTDRMAAMSAISIVVVGLNLIVLGSVLFKGVGCSMTWNTNRKPPHV